ncbi:MAG: 4-hydroxy-tetrahydrodipicolinate reductase [Haloarculaceae archaeon]
MTVAVTGATGRMGEEVLDAAAERGVEVAFAVAPRPATVDGVQIQDDDRFAALLDREAPDAVVDFTVPEATVRYAEACAERGVPFVTGTTGFDEEELAAVEAASERTPVLKAANFARGVQALLRVVREAVAAMPAYDVELTETHHNGKRDAPSGTAKTILQAVDEARVDAADAAPLERVYGREGHDPRTEGQVGVHVRRAGDVRGEHEVLLAGNDEVVTLTHRAESRGVFAAGALDAAEWLAGRPAGWYDFEDAL